MADTQTTESEKLIERIQTGKQDLGHGVFVEAIEDGRIFLFDLTMSSQGINRHASDVWADAVIQVIREEDRVPALILHNLVNAKITPYGRKRAQDILNYCKEHSVRTSYAMIVDNNIIGQAIRIFSNVTIGMSHPEGITAKVFTNHADAVKYLKQFITP